LQGTSEFIDSIMNQRNNPVGGARWPNSLADDTAFLASFQTERADGGFVYDGISTGNENAAITIKGVPIYGGDNDTYHYPRCQLNGQVIYQANGCAPQLWIDKDTFWLIGPDQCKYMLRGTPAGY
jgi:hypothetical protein